MRCCLRRRGPPLRGRPRPPFGGGSDKNPLQRPLGPFSPGFERGPRAKVKACSSSSCRPLRELFTKALVRVREPFLYKRSRAVLLPELLDEKFADSQYQECLLLKQDDLSGCVGVGMGHVRLALLTSLSRRSYARLCLPMGDCSTRPWRACVHGPRPLICVPLPKGPAYVPCQQDACGVRRADGARRACCRAVRRIRERPHARRVPLSGVRACAVALPQRHAPRRHLSGVCQTCRDPAPCAGPRAAGTLRPRLLSSRRAVSQPVSR